MSDLTSEQLEAIAVRQPIQIPPFLQRRHDAGTYSDAAMLQFEPSAQELMSDPEGYSVDPTDEQNRKVTGIAIQAYPDKVAMTLTTRCLCMCRFCFRGAFVGRGEPASQDQLYGTYEYIAANPQVHDVLLSGGDPFAVRDRPLATILARLADIPTVDIIRLDTRAASVEPRVVDRHPTTLEAMRIINAEGKARVDWYGHMNHPDDVDDDEVRAALGKVHAVTTEVDRGDGKQRAGVYNQCVLLAGVNDDPDVMERLMVLCQQERVIPYDLYLLDHVHGASHFEVPDDQVVVICQRLAQLAQRGVPIPSLAYVSPQTDQKVRFDLRAPFDEKALRTFLDQHHVDQGDVL